MTSVTPPSSRPAHALAREEECAAWMGTLHEEAGAAAHGTPLPAEPDRARVEDFLIRVRRASVLRDAPLGTG